ncbi:MAG: glycosyltransferase family 4 protein [Cephaloticoccus sp.]|nr:glycosyltransferase family 4 protein [Cephaloticoccus sp.]
MSTSMLCGEIESSRPLRARGGKITITGWCLVKGQREPPPVRLVTNAGELAMIARHDRADVAALMPDEPAAATSGFSLAGSLPPGIHLGRCEALLPDGTWQAFRQLSIASEAPPFIAVLDEPIYYGTLHDRVKVGGWALDPLRPTAELFLRYGHREISCVINQLRADVPLAYPDTPHAMQAGFTSEDFLVAGHGPVRVRARLADGTTLVASTKVSFSIATDENHSPELDLTAPRIGLGTVCSTRPPNPPVPITLSHRNILFILPGNFAANSALHVTALANELVAAGFTCSVAAAHNLKALYQHERPLFSGITHEDAAAGVTFPDGRGPDLIHAWTTRENVRRLAERIRSLYGSKLVVHLEDNEQEILAVTLGRNWQELVTADDAELDRIVPDDLSHPRHSQIFLESANGVTVITDGLREFAPADRPCHTIWPAADARYFGPRTRPDDFRRILDPTPGTTMLFYHGNVHASNRAEVRELYAAVLELNRTSDPVMLLRTGLDTIDFLGEMATDVAPYVINIGLILHRHIAPLMALADIFVQPGVPGAFNDYRFPSKLPEFFSVGRPVVLPRTNLGKNLRHGRDAYVLERADANGIIGAIRTLRKDPALCEQLARGALAYAREHFNWQRSAAALATFYNSLSPS